MKLKLLLFAFFLSFFCVLLNLNLGHKEYYTALLLEKTEMIVEGSVAPRGRILDCHGKVLVDNRGVLNIVYHKNASDSIHDEIRIAKNLSRFVDRVSLSFTQLKNYYLATNNNGNDLIQEEEWKMWDERKLTNEDLSQLKWERITEDMLQYSLDEQKIIYLFSKMKEGYQYQDKILFSDVSESFVAEILELQIPSIQVGLTFERIYPYGETLKSIFGSIGSIPAEKVEDFLEDGYALNDIVGVSGLESEYESILKGTKSKYFVNSDNSLTLLSEGVPGNDITLHIDIDIELELERILKEEMLLASQLPSAKFFRDSYAMIGDPKTGGIVALSGLHLNQDQTFQDITITSFTSSYAMGSVVKGASSTVGYLSGGIDVGKKVLDACIKLYSEPSKCSYTRLGYVDDISALKTSSNYFQFLTAIQSTGQKYSYNMQFSVTEKDFQRYRNIFAGYGLGSKTNVDYPIEQTGMKGEKVAGDLLLNFAIGQYDTYTPISLLQYINTLANYGARYALRFQKNDVPIFLNQVPLDSMYYDRITEGLYQVFHGGTASSYVKSELEAVGKTGTSETFYDSDEDGVVDTPVINSTVIFYYPRSHPVYSMVVVAPSITYISNTNYPFTRNVSLKMTQFLKI